MLRIAICDDSQLWLQKIETLTRGYLKKINVKYRLDLYQSGEKLLKSITSPYDIALLDVDLHSTNGIEVASQLRATNPQIVLIFVSEYVEYAPFGYEVDAIRYLLKNHLEQAFDRVMSEAVKKVREKHLRYAIVTDAGNVMVKFEDILYVEGQKHGPPGQQTEQQRNYADIQLMGGRFMIEQISLLTVDLIGHISCLLLCTALFRRTCAKRQLVLAFLGTLAAGYLITVVPVIREFPIKAILLVMVFTVFCHACYEGKILTQCLCAVFSYVIMLALDTAAIFLFCNWVGMPREQIFADPQLYMICALFSYIVIFVVSFAIWRFAQSWTKIEKISVSGFLAMLVFPLVSLGTITFLFQVTAKDHSVSHWAIVNALGLVAANAVLMGLLHHIEQEAEERKQNVALQHQFETQLEKTQVLLEAQTAQRKQTHDFKHHLSVLGGLLQEENLAAARQYLAEISETGQLDALAVHSNNPVVDAILNQKYAQACELGIQVDFAINDLAEFPLSNKETVVVLSNLLDNAIEACKTQKGTRLIRVKIQCSEEKTILSVMNTIDKAPVMENGLPVTTKADPLAHGYGLQNIVSILADHGACPAILCQDGWFQFSTVLFHQTISPAPEHDQITQKSL